MESVTNLSFNIFFPVPETGEAATAPQLIKAIISHSACVCVCASVRECTIAAVIKASALRKSVYTGMTQHFRICFICIEQQRHNCWSNDSMLPCTIYYKREKMLGISI